MYADDSVLFFTSLCTLEINKVVRDNLNRVAQSMESNKLILNQSKTKSLLFGSRQLQLVIELHLIISCYPGATCTWNSWLLVVYIFLGSPGMHQDRHFNTTGQFLHGW